MAVETGTPAPAFDLPTKDGKNVSLAGLKGKKVVLYFYPKDDTPGCTTEACGFRDNMAKFTQNNAVVLGVSPDDVTSHGKFAEKFHLPFPLLADTNHATAEQYGVWKEKNSFGTKSMGIERSTFVIDTAGKIAHVFPKVKVDGHTAEVLAAVKAAK